MSEETISPLDKRFCVFCKSRTSYNYGRGPQWHRIQQGLVCGKCYSKLFTNPKWRKIHNPRTGARRFVFGNTRPLSTFKQRTGFCSRCPRNIHDGTCKITNMHHWVYIIIIPWFGREELCVPCHNLQRIGMCYHKK